MSDEHQVRSAVKPDRREIARWRRYLANERAEAAIYRDLSSRRHGEEREILLAIAEAEKRHEQHWVELLGENVGKPRKATVRIRLLGFFARRFGSVFVLALAQHAESRSPYTTERAATPQMAADEHVHEEIVRALSERGREELSGTFRAAIFGINDGLVSNLALVLGVSAAGVASHIVLLTGLSGLLAGALSMGAGEYVSVRSQRELLAASQPNPETQSILPQLDVNANELALVYRARGMSPDHAQIHAQEVLHSLDRGSTGDHGPVSKATQALSSQDEYTALGRGWKVALSSFCFFAIGAFVPLIPFLLGATGLTALLTAIVLVGIVLAVTGAIVGVLSGGSPWRLALRQLGIAYAAAAITYALGLLFGVSLG